MNEKDWRGKVEMQVLAKLVSTDENQGPSENGDDASVRIL